jgi:hypothetical protein
VSFFQVKELALTRLLNMSLFDEDATPVGRGTFALLRHSATLSMVNGCGMATEVVSRGAGDILRASEKDTMNV